MGYGTTKIEAEAAAHKKEKVGDTNDGASDDDHAFFVNVGDLEMEDGYLDDDFDEADGWMDAVVKEKRKRKRVVKEKEPTLKEVVKPKPSVKKSKNTSDKAKKPKSKSSAKKVPSKISDGTSETKKADKSKKRKSEEEKDSESSKSNES